jgi:hypothetical protein
VIVVFVGPSYPEAKRDFPSLDIRPPAVRGDLLDAAHRGTSAIGLIDGVFGARLAVSPTEVRSAASLGVEIFGAASMGALRAAECPGSITPFGEIAQAFVRGELADEDWVACTFDETYRMVSHPLVNIAAAIRKVAPEMSLDAARALPFDRRTPSDVLAALKSEAVVAAMLDPDNDVKRRDAHALLTYLAQLGH